MRVVLLPPRLAACCSRILLLVLLACSLETTAAATADEIMDALVPTAAVPEAAAGWRALPAARLAAVTYERLAAMPAARRLPKVAAASDEVDACASAAVPMLASCCCLPLRDLAAAAAVNANTRLVEAPLAAIGCALSCIGRASNGDRTHYNRPSQRKSIKSTCVNGIHLPA